MVPKSKGEILGVVIVESGWGSMLPTIVLANLSPSGPAARCGQLNIGDQVRHSDSYALLLLTTLWLVQLLPLLVQLRHVSHSGLSFGTSLPDNRH